MSSTRSGGVRIPAALIADIVAFISAVWFDLGVPTSELRVEIAGELAQLYEVKVNEDGGSAFFIERLMAKFDKKMCEKIANDVIDEKKKHPRREELPNWCEENEVVWEEDLGDDVTEIMSAAFPEGQEGDDEKEEEEDEVMEGGGGSAGAGGGGGGGTVLLLSKKGTVLRTIIVEHFALPQGFNPEMAFEWLEAAIEQLAAYHPKNITVLKDHEDLVLPSLRTRELFLDKITWLKEKSKLNDIDKELWGNWAYITCVAHHKYIHDEMQALLKQKIVNVSAKNQNVAGLLFLVKQKFLNHLSGRAAWFTLIHNPQLKLDPTDTQTYDVVLRAILDYFLSRMESEAGRVTAIARAAAETEEAPVFLPKETNEVDIPLGSQHSAMRRTAGAVSKYLDKLAKRASSDELD